MLILSYFSMAFVRMLSKEWNGDVSASLLLLFLDGFRIKSKIVEYSDKFPEFETQLLNRKLNNL